MVCLKMRGCRTKSLALKSAATWVARCWSLPRCGSAYACAAHDTHDSHLVFHQPLHHFVFGRLRETTWHKLISNYAKPEFWSVWIRVPYGCFTAISFFLNAMQPHNPTDQWTRNTSSDWSPSVSRCLAFQRCFLWSRTCFSKTDTKFDEIFLILSHLSHYWVWLSSSWARCFNLAGWRAQFTFGVGGAYRRRGSHDDWQQHWALEDSAAAKVFKWKSHERLQSKGIVIGFSIAMSCQHWLAEVPIQCW